MDTTFASIPWGPFIAEWIHILAGIFWFGSTLYTTFVLIPALNTLPFTEQRSIARALNGIAPRAARIAGGITIIMGILRGTVWGRIDGSDVLFPSRYGIVWLIALIAAIATFAWGEGVIRPKLARVSSDDPIFMPGPDGTLGAQATAEISRLKLYAGLELLGFLTIFTCMILLQFS